MEKKRIRYIDTIKVFLTCLVVTHHAGQAYGNTGGVWLVADQPQLGYLKPFFFFNAAFMMGFYFFISGYFTYSSLLHKTARQYLTERVIRLGIPLLFFTALVMGPLHYCLSGSRSAYLPFLLDLHLHHPPLSTGHLWFVASLLAYSVMGLLLVKGTPFTVRLSARFRAWYPLVYLLLLIPVNVLVRQTYPIDRWVTWLIPLEPAHLPQYLSLFLLGILFRKTGWLDSIPPVTALSYTAAGLLLFFFRDLVAARMPALWSESLTESFLCVGLCMGLILLFKSLPQGLSSIVQFLSENAYGIYLFHLLIVIGLQQMLVTVQLDTNLKFILVTLLGVFLSATLSAGLRKIPFMKRVL